MSAYNSRNGFTPLYILCYYMKRGATLSSSKLLLIPIIELSPLANHKYIAIRY